MDSSEGEGVGCRGRGEEDYCFRRHDEHRIELSRGRHLTLTPRQRAGPLNFFVYPQVEVDGKKHDGVTGKFTFRDR